MTGLGDETTPLPTTTSMSMDDDIDEAATLPRLISINIPTVQRSIET